MSAVVAAAVRAGETAVSACSAVVGSVGRTVAAMVRSRSAAAVRGIVVVTAVGSGGRGVVRSAVTVM